MSVLHSPSIMVSKKRVLDTDSMEFMSCSDYEKLDDIQPLCRSLNRSAIASVPIFNAKRFRSSSYIMQPTCSGAENIRTPNNCTQYQVEQQISTTGRKRNFIAEEEKTSNYGEEPPDSPCTSPIKMKKIKFDPQQNEINSVFSNVETDTKFNHIDTAYGGINQLLKELHFLRESRSCTIAHEVSSPDKSHEPGRTPASDSLFISSSSSSMDIDSEHQYSTNSAVSSPISLILQDLSCTRKHEHEYRRRLREEEEQQRMKELKQNTSGPFLLSFRQRQDN